MVDELIGHWKMDEGTGTLISDSVGDADATATACTFAVGKYGYSIKLPGIGGGVSIPTNSTLDTLIGGVGKAFTITVWYKYADGFTTAFLKWDSGTGYVSASVAIGAGYIFAYQNGVSGYTLPYLSTNELVDGEWHHIALVRDTANVLLKLYVDGVMRVSAADTNITDDLTSTAAWYLGNDSTGYGYRDDFRVYNYALTTAQVVESMKDPSLLDAGFHVEYIGDSGSLNITKYIVDFKLEEELEKLLDKLNLKVSRSIENETLFNDFLPHHEIVIYFNGSKIWGGRVKDSLKGEIYNLTIFSYGEELGRRYSNRIYENMAPEDIFTEIITAYTGLTPITVASGIIIRRFIAFDYVDSVCMKLAQILGWQLKTDVEKNIYLQPRGYITNVSRTLTRSPSGANAIYGPWEKDHKQLANYLIVKGEDLTYNTSQTFTGVGVDAPIIKAFLSDGGVFTDFTTEANNATTDDVNLLPAAEVIDDAFYFGGDHPFSFIKFVITTPGVGSGITWEYYNGTSWTTLTTTDGTTQFTTAGTNSVTFDIPTDWIKLTVNAELKYWVRSRCTTASYTTQPKASRIYIDGANFTLTERPSQIKVFVDSVEQDKTVYEVTSELKRVTFDTAPDSGKSVVIDYGYIYPIYLERSNPSSINTYGQFTKYLWVKWAKTGRDAREFAIDYLNTYSDPFYANDITIPINWIADISVGEHIRIVDTFEGIDDYFTIERLTFELTKGKMIIHVGPYIPNAILWQQEVMDRIKELNKSQMLTEILQLAPPAESDTANIAETLTEASLSYVNLDGTNNQQFDSGRGSVNDSRFTLSRFV